MKQKETTFQEIRDILKENAKQIQELKELQEKGYKEFKDSQKKREKENQEFKENQEKRDKEFKKNQEKRDKEFKENQEKRDKEFKEYQNQLAKEKEKRDKEFKEYQKELAKSREKRDKEFKEYQKETFKQIKEINERFGGHQNTQSDIIEDLFFNSLCDHRVLNHITFDEISKGGKFVLDSKNQTEIDIILYNGEYIALVEVKEKVKTKHLKQVEKHIKIYKACYPKDDRKILFFFASFNFRDKIKEKAQEKGYGLLSLKNKIVQVETENIKEFVL